MEGIKNIAHKNIRCVNKVKKDDYDVWNHKIFFEVCIMILNAKRHILIHNVNQDKIIYGM